MSRLRSIDVVRGSAMVLVVMAHVFGLCDTAKIGPWVSSHFGILTQSASVAFMFTSGMIGTYLMQLSDDWSKVRRKLIKRGLFLIFIVHPLLLLVTYEYFTNQRSILYNLVHIYQITDTIGLCLIIAPTAIRATSQKVRRGLIVALLLITIVVRILWHPQSVVLGLAKISVFGTDPETNPSINVGWPLLPWLAIYMCGSFAGELYTKVRVQLLTYAEAAKRSWRAALILAASGTVLFAAYWLLKHTNPFNWSVDTFLIIYPSRTTSLLPIYLSVIVSVIAFLVVRVDGRHYYNRVFWGLSIFGRTSLFTFVTQFIVVWSLPALLGIKGSLGYWGFITTVCAGLAICGVLAYWYGRIRGRVAPNEYERLTAVLAH